MIRKIRLARLDRSYRRIAKVEAKVGLAEEAVVDLRLMFATETMAMVDSGLIGKGIPRQARRSMQRGLVTGRRRGVVASKT